MIAAPHSPVGLVAELEKAAGPGAASIGWLLYGRGYTDGENAQRQRGLAPLVAAASDVAWIACVEPSMVEVLERVGLDLDAARLRRTLEDARTARLATARVVRAR